MGGAAQARTCLLVQPHLLPLPGEGLQPALLLLRLPGTQQEALARGAAAQPEGVLDAPLQVPVLAVPQVHHLQALQVQPALVVQHAPAEEVLQGRRGRWPACLPQGPAPPPPWNWKGRWASPAPPHPP